MDGVPVAVGFAVEIRLLGPVEVLDGGRALDVGPPQQRHVVAALAVDAGRPVMADTLVDRVWDEAPDGARRALHAHVARIRRMLADAGGVEKESARLERRSGGYVLDIAPDLVDLHRYDGLINKARERLRSDGERAKLLSAALEQWRGEPLAGLPGQWAAGVREEWRQRRLDTVVAWARAELRVGDPGVVVGRMTALVREYPLVESLAAALMRALCAAGRSTEALDCYTATRRRLVDELGVDPGSELQRLHQAILRGGLDQPSPSPAETPIVVSTPLAEAAASEDGGSLMASLPAESELAPLRRSQPVLSSVRSSSSASVAASPLCQLPAAVAAFTGRHDELAQLRAALAPGGDDALGRPAVAVVYGGGGVGKSALAIHAAHSLAERFPDGQLYVDLHGSTAGFAPLSPAEVLGRFLRALGVDGSAIPAHPDEAASNYRMSMADRRMLVVLDNAADARQVQPLLPGSSTCAVLVTSRQPLPTLDGATNLHLDVLEPDPTRELLERLIGRQRVAAEPEEAMLLAQRCAYLPLALCIAGARLVARPQWPVRVLAERLGDERRRLDELRVADLAVRASFEVSYQALRDSGDHADARAARIFRLVGVLDVVSLSVPVVAALADQDALVAEDALERLVDAQLLDTPTPGRYRLHDLLRLFARELAANEETDITRQTGLHRALHHYLASARRASWLFRPVASHRHDEAEIETEEPAAPYTRAEALAWLETERPNLVIAARQAADGPPVLRHITTGLAEMLFYFMYMRGHWRDWQILNQLALQVARTYHDRAAEAQALSDLGGIDWRLGEFERALMLYDQALATAREVNDRTREAAILSNIGCAHLELDQHKEARSSLERALTLQQQLDNLTGSTTTLNNLARAHGLLGRWDDAVACYQRALILARDCGDRATEAIVRANLGEAFRQLGRIEDAVAYCQYALALCREYDDREREGLVLIHLSEARRVSGEAQTAINDAEQALTSYQAISDRYGEAKALRQLGDALDTAQRHGRARSCWQQAIQIFQQFGSPEADKTRARLQDHAPPGT